MRSSPLVRMTFFAFSPDDLHAGRGQVDRLPHQKGLERYPHTDPRTGVAHTCGHNAQIAMMLGVGMGLVDSGVLADLAGRVVPLAVPAAEYAEARLGVRLDDLDSAFSRAVGERSQTVVSPGFFTDSKVAASIHTLVGAWR